MSDSLKLSKNDSRLILRRFKLYYIGFFFVNSEKRDDLLRKLRKSHIILIF